MLLKHLAFLFCATLWCWSAPPESEEDKKNVTRSLYESNAEVLKMATSPLSLRTDQPIHPLYVMLLCIHTNLIENVDSWVVDYLLTTGGHWGWDTSGRTANTFEVNIYRETAMCHFWEDKTRQVQASAPDLLKQIKRQADWWLVSLTQDDWLGCISEFRKSSLIKTEQVFFTAEDGTGSMNIIQVFDTDILGEKNPIENDFYFVNAYFDIAEQVRVEKAKGVDISQLPVPGGRYVDLKDEHSISHIKRMYECSLWKDVKDGNWHGYFILDRRVRISKNLSGTLSGKKGQDFGGLGIVSPQDVEFTADMTPEQFYQEVLKIGASTVEIWPPVLGMFLKSK